MHLSRSYMRKAIFCAILVLILGAIAPVISAQDGTAEVGNVPELIDRAMNALLSVDTYTSFNIELQSEENQQSTINIPGSASQESSSKTMLNASGTLIFGDQPNASMKATATSEDTNNATTTSFSMEGEYRYVDGKLYVKAQYTDSKGDVPELSNEWTVVDDPANFPQFSALKLKDFLDNLKKDSNDVIDAFAKLKDQVTSASVRQDKIEDTPVDVVTLTFGWEAFKAILTDQGDFQADDPMVGLFEKALTGQNKLITLHVAIDDSDQLRGAAFIVSMKLENLDLSAIGSGVPAGTTMTLIMDITEVRTFTHINEEFTPVTAPE